VSEQGGIAWKADSEDARQVSFSQSVDPRTTRPFGPRIWDTTPEDLSCILDLSGASRVVWAVLSPLARAAALSTVADALDASSNLLVELADRETALGTTRLSVELARSTYQLRMFASALRNGQLNPVELDRAAEGQPPAGHPEIRRIYVPLGVAAVFGASNFPFAFGACGGDVASGLAAGCCVVVKAHPSHPQTSQATADTIVRALASAGMPAGVYSLVFGVDAGRRLIQDDRVDVASFTGSPQGGLALWRLANERDRPIPFFGELGSVNPVVATPSGITHIQEFVSDYLDSLTLGAGQLCTNPGLLLVPRGLGVLEQVASQLQQRDVGPLLNENVLRRLEQHVAELLTIPNSEVVAAGREALGWHFPPTVITAPIEEAVQHLAILATECFGPVGLVVEYGELTEVREVISGMPGCLVGSLFASEEDDVSALVTLLAKVAGRVAWRQWPTGVAVTPSQHHGGPYPASTDSRQTSVGLHSVERFRRPLVLQGFPDVAALSVG